MLGKMDITLRIVKMKTYKEVTVKHRDKTICDWCKEEVKNPQGRPEDTYDMDIDLKYKIAYNEWGDYWYEPESWTVDLCPSCMDKVKQFLMDGGCELQEVDY